MRKLLLKSIGLYQSHISPFKGFKCAYGVLHKNGTCSSRIKEIISQEKISEFPKLIYKQFKNCKHAYRVISNEEKDKDKEDNDLAKCFILECGAQSCPCIFL